MSGDGQKGCTLLGRDQTFGDIQSQIGCTVQDNVNDGFECIGG